MAHDRKRSHRRPRAVRSVLAVMVCVLGLALAACGSSSTFTGAESGSTPPKAHAEFLAFSECMRAHGVSSFPDPSSGGGGFQIQSSAHINPFSPSFKAARSHCRHLLPGGGPPTGPPSRQALAAAVTTAQCMRSHGISSFPDPTTKPPASPNGFSIIEDRNGVITAVPASVNPSSPAFQAASKVCGFN